MGRNKHLNTIISNFQVFLLYLNSIRSLKWLKNIDY
nr:MAG TPA: hypothetical protein [Caudoviricetes sp.]DAU47676.1 MAG TPA: hypothetical protein [Caudoviricetes sp.]